MYAVMMIKKNTLTRESNLIPKRHYFLFISFAEQQKIHLKNATIKVRRPSSKLASKTKTPSQLSRTLREDLDKSAQVQCLAYGIGTLITAVNSLNVLH